MENPVTTEPVVNNLKESKVGGLSAIFEEITKAVAEGKSTEEEVERVLEPILTKIRPQKVVPMKDYGDK